MQKIPNIHQVTGQRVRGGYQSKLSPYTLDENYLAKQLSNLREGRYINYDGAAVKTNFFLKAKPEVQALFTQKAINSMTYSAGSSDARRSLRDTLKACSKKGIMNVLRDYYKIPENFNERNAIKTLMEKMLTKVK